MTIMALICSKVLGALKAKNKRTRSVSSKNMADEDDWERLAKGKEKKKRGTMSDKSLK